MASTLPDLAHAGTRGGIAAAFAYASIREKLFAGEPRIALKVKDRYTLLGKLGEGTSGVVFAAYDSQLDRKIALKVLRTPGDATGAARLAREARSLAQISDPHVVQVHDADEYRGEVFLAMEFVAGEPLDAWIARTRPTFPQLLDVLIAVGQGLAAAHRKNIVHRDVKPANILVDEEGRARVADFGIAWTEQHEPSSHGERHNTNSMASTMPSMLTHNGAGTPAYMSPEQCDRKPVDPRSDLFSYCVVVWEAVHGVRPFVADSAITLMVAISTGHITAAARPRGVPARLEQVLRRGLAVDPDRRYPSMAALLTELGRIRHPRRPTRWLLGLGIGLGAALALLANTMVAGHCVRAAAEIDEIWSPARAAEIVAAFERSGEAHAPGTARTIVARLDAFAAQLKQIGADNCEAHDDGHLSESQYHRSQQCLADRQWALAHTVASLGDPTAALLASPEEITAALGPVDRCEDRNYLSATLEAPADADQPAVAAVEALRRRGEDELLRGQFNAAARSFEQAVVQARTIGHASTTARALYDLGRTYIRLFRSDDAEPLLREARTLADRAGDDFTAADAAFLLFDNAVERNDLAEGEPRYHEALAKLHRIRRDRGGPLGELELLRGALLLGLDRRTEAMEVFDRAERELEDPNMPPGLWRVTLWRSRVTVASLRDDMTAATEAAKQAQLALRKLVGSDDHPLFATELAEAQIAAGQLAAAEASLPRIRDICERAFGPDSIPMARVYLAMTRLYEKRGDRERRFAAVQRADEIFKQHPADSMTLIDRVAVAGFLGRALKLEGRVDEALAAYGSGIAALTAVDLPALDNAFAMLASARADIWRNQAAASPGALEHAAADIDAALARFPAARRGSDPRTAKFMLRVAADVALDRGDLVATQQRAEEALALLKDHPDPDTRARVVYTLAKALGPAHARAQTLAAEAVADFIRAGQPDNAAEVTAWAAAPTPAHEEQSRH